MVRVEARFYDQILAKSLTTTTIEIKPKDADLQYGRIPLPKRYTLEEARTEAAKLKELAYGLVHHQEGYAIRTKRCDEKVCRAKLQSELTEVIGEELMLAEIADGNIYEIGGIDKNVFKQALAEFCTNKLKWPVEPLRVIPRTQFMTDHIVLALEPPPCTMSPMQNPVSKDGNRFV